MLLFHSSFAISSVIVLLAVFPISTCSPHVHVLSVLLIASL